MGAFELIGPVKGEEGLFYEVKSVGDRADALRWAHLY